MSISNPTSSAAATIQSLKRIVTDGEIDLYNTQGYCLFKQLLPPDAAGELREEVEEIMSVVGLGVVKLRQTHQYLKGGGLDAYIHGELLRGLASQLLGRPAHLYLPFTAVKSGGGGGRFHFHQDNNYTRWLGPGINLWTALSPMRPENGALQILPQSHLNGDLKSVNAGDGDNHRKVDFEPDKFDLIEMEPGDCVAFTRWTVHGSGPNTTSKDRVAYAVQFHRDDTVALVDGVETRLLENPRFKDIHGVDQIMTDGFGSRDGH